MTSKLFKENYMERVDLLKKRIVNSMPEIDLENALILTKSFQETEGEPLVLRKAKAFYKQCKEKTIEIQDRELLVGCSGSKLRAGIINPETCWTILNDEIDTINTRPFDPFNLRKEEKKSFEEKIRPYWKGKSTYEEWLAQIPAETRQLRDHKVIFLDRKVVRGWGETTAGYKFLLTSGITGIVEVINKRKLSIDTTVPGDYEKEYYLESLLTVAKGIILLAERYSKEAERLANQETDTKRKEELIDIAKTCACVPKEPAKSFKDAIQSIFLYQIMLFMEQNASSYNIGRLDQILYPYYKADIDAGILTKEEAQELLNCFWVKLSESCIFQDATTAQFSAGYCMFQNITVGGVDTSGQDAVNELSYMILQATMEVQLFQPSLSVRYNLAKNPNTFLRKIVELTKLGTGFPAFHNDEAGISMVLNKGVPLKEAYDWNPAGCVETNLEGRMRQITNIAQINLGSLIELALLDGKKRNSKDQVSIKTGNAEEFKSFEAFYDAIKCQISSAIRAVVKGNHVIDEVFMNRPVPVLSLTFKDCIESAKDYAWGGAKYNNGNGINMIGVADLVNSLVAVRELVYIKKEISMKELLEALENNFENYEDIQSLCLSIPKYGNDNSLADKISGEIMTFIADEIEQYKSKFGHMTLGIFPVSGNTPFGMEVGALPSGRKAGTPLADGVSPSGGTDVNGPSSVLKSVSNLPHSRFNQGTLLNMKVEPDMIASEKGITQMMNLLKTVCSLGIYHVQFNVIDKEKLLEAQKNPNEYRDLLVRVAGYSAYFVELGKEIQNEIIGRTTQVIGGKYD